MASFFGEIIEPSTRAIFDEYTDEEDSTADPKLQLSWAHGDEKVPTVLDAFFIIHGRLSLAFAEAYLFGDNSSPLAEINILKNRTDEDRDIETHECRDLPCRIFTDKGIGICLVSPSCPVELGYSFAETVSPFLENSKKVIIFTNETVYNFKTSFTYELPPAFVMELRTSYNQSSELARPLPSPNFITGIPAGVLSWCEIFKKDASSFICYTDQEKLDSVTASPYISVLKKLSYNIIKNKNPDFNKKSFYGKPEVIGGSSNIYI